MHVEAHHAVRVLPRVVRVAEPILVALRRRLPVADLRTIDDSLGRLKPIRSRLQSRVAKKERGDLSLQQTIGVEVGPPLEVRDIDARRKIEHTTPPLARERVVVHRAPVHREHRAEGRRVDQRLPALVRLVAQVTSRANLVALQIVNEPRRRSSSPMVSKGHIGPPLHNVLSQHLRQATNHVGPIGALPLHPTVAQRTDVEDLDLAAQPLEPLDPPVAVVVGVDQLGIVEDRDLDGAGSSNLSGHSTLE